MPTDVYFIGKEQPLRLRDEYEEVTKQLNGRVAGEFRLAGSGATVTIYKTAVACVAEAQAGEVFAA